ncbi:hypothetical protein HII31_03822 [Pseudocercospora fuligena]|uniref:Uncharacterized protein n=1 Tax=Pseudocercospora fuligena TaxID=685502 RepID=A0A8H6VLM1_9PEZI|nr:hypothetical protein HII31_03822 [Pseudocercospora fuligena]
MIGTLLLATFAGVGVASPAGELAGRSSSPQSYFCSSSKSNCVKAKQQDSVTAYCSSLLSVPKVTVTKTRTVCSTTTATITKVTGTKTASASTVTSTISSCLAPIGAQKRAVEADIEKRYSNPKPSCLSQYSKASDITSACKCLSLQPQTVTSTVTKSDIKTATRTVQTDSTVSASSTVTSYVYPPNPTIVVADNDGNFFGRSPNCGVKQICNGFTANPNMNNALLLELNAANGGLYPVYNGAVSDQILGEIPDGQQPYLVQVTFEDAVAENRSQALTCSLSVPVKDNNGRTLCPLSCNVRAGDTNQFGSSSYGSTWNIAPPGAVSSSNFQTFAVTPRIDNTTDVER